MIILPIALTPSSKAISTRAFGVATIRGAYSNRQILLCLTKVNNREVRHFRFDLRDLGRRAVERPILDCLADVIRLDAVGALEIGDRARDFEDPRIGAGAQAEPIDRELEQG